MTVTKDIGFSDNPDNIEMQVACRLDHPPPPKSPLQERKQTKKSGIAHLTAAAVAACVWRRRKIRRQSLKKKALTLGVFHLSGGDYQQCLGSDKLTCIQRASVKYIPSEIAEARRWCL